VRYHESIVAFLQKVDRDPEFCVRLVSSLPKEITEKYYEERNREGYEIPLAKSHLSRNTQSISAQRASQLLFTTPQTDSTTGQANNELFSNSIAGMQTIRLNHADTKYIEEIPLVIFMLTTFFEN